MIEIKDIEFYQETNGQLFYSGQTTTKKELIRPFIKFKNTNGNYVKDWDNQFSRSGFLKVNPFASKFSHHDLVFLAKTYDFKVVQHKKYKEVYTGYITAKDILKEELGEYIYIEEEGVNYLMLFFKRWQFSNQPRSAGEDAMGEDVTYIHGIWENPDLPPEIIKKIKS